MPHQLYAFGSNGEAQLGIPAKDIVSTPNLVLTEPFQESIRSIHGGDNHTLILTESGTVWGVGDNRKSQLGIPRAGQTRAGRFEELYNGISFCAAACESTAYICNPGTEFNETASPIIFTEGFSRWGELGRFDVTSTSGLTGFQHKSDTRICDQFKHVGTLNTKLPHPVVDFTAGGWHYAAVLANGEVWGWGKARHEQLGATVPQCTSITSPIRIEGIPFPAKKVVCGKEFTYIASASSTGEHVLLGKDKFNIKSHMPAHIRGWKDIGATWHAVFVLFDDGRLAAWGKENMWKLIPPNLPSIEKIAVGSDHVLAVTKEGGLISWGWGKHGNCGDVSQLEPRPVNDMVSGFWNEIDIPGEIQMIGAGFCTSFVLSSVDGNAAALTGLVD
ncbi:regulator of chromosome condensation 1/beta-lactamase-inhibitor protein II [Massariosphaeria phaeospora]|uniref:Regulator of chromosome condensation 1/beta-lactamase-inhibitor protein II n=1 Tax=Massariosphaeria phaeospora TaxID=100035 RepID=A0A7C8IAA9_9PLEO|nr:regulator of chromosome condensation 1/beta-lactamase-inhibitor protein II [Massariosphaeria phaeospora]